MLKIKNLYGREWEQQPWPKNVDRKQKRINEIVQKILETYPPGSRR
jgi:hypothetical protein